MKNMTTSLLQRIDNLTKEIQSIQLKLKNESLPIPQVPVDALLLIIKHLNVDDLMELRCVSKEFNLAAEYILRFRSLQRLEQLKLIIHDAENQLSIVKQSSAPDIRANLEFLQDAHTIQKVYSEYGYHKDHISTLVMQCMAILYSSTELSLQFRSRRFKSWFYSLEIAVDSLNSIQIQKVEDLIRDNNITYDLARSKSNFTFRLLILVAAMIEVYKLKEAVLAHENNVVELGKEAHFFQNLVDLCSKSF